jgi:hypothetical protein
MLLQSSTYQSRIHICNKTRRLQTYVLMSWIRIDFYGLRLRSWSFLCVTFHASLFVHALWVFTSKISLGIHPKPKTFFVITFLSTTQFEYGVKLSMEIQIFRKIMEFILTLAVVSPLFYARGRASFKHGGGVTSRKPHIHDHFPVTIYVLVIEV